MGSDIAWAPVELFFGNRRYDFLGFADYVYLEYNKTVAVQIGGPGTHKAHRDKILAEPRALQWLRCGNHILLVTWSKRKQGWTARWESITENMFNEENR